MSDAPERVTAWGDTTAPGIVYGACARPMDGMVEFSASEYIRADLLAAAIARAERAEAALAVAEEALREISDSSHNLWEVSVARAAIAKIEALKGDAE